MKKSRKNNADKENSRQEKANQTAQCLTRKEVERQLRSGNLTKEQAIELRQRYMDSLEYNAGEQAVPSEDGYVVSCGGIKPSFLPIMEEEED